MKMHGIAYDEFGGIDRLRLRELAVPQVDDDEVLILVRAASLNAFDWKMREGALQKFFDVPFPITPGRDGCGDVVALGRTVARDESAALEQGQRVCFVSSRLQRGAFADLIAVKARDFVVPAPTTLSDVQCAALPLAGLAAWNALVDTAQLQRGMRLLVHGGSGGVGSMAIQIATHIGAEVFATCSAAKVGSVEKLGAVAIPYDRVSFTDAVSKCDVVFDTVGGDVHEKSYTVLKPGGCLVYLIAKPFSDVSDAFDVRTLQAVVQNRTENLRRVTELAESGALIPIVGVSLPQTDFVEAFRCAESGGPGGKIVLFQPREGESE